MIIQFGNRTYQLGKGQGFSPQNMDLTQYQERILKFCSDYLSGKKSFELSTSGTTGIPKTIVVSDEQMKQSARATIKALSLTSQDRALLCLNADYIGGKMMLVRAIEADMKLVVFEPSSIPLPSDNMGITFTALVPLQASSLLQSSRGRRFLSTCRNVIIGGAPLNRQLEETFKTFRNHVYHTFGMTETVSHIALRKLSGPIAESVYTALAAMQISTDHRGCLVANGPMTNQQDVITNDLVEIIDSNHFRWLGRLDDVINSGGYKIHPYELQQRIREIVYDSGVDCEVVVTHQKDEKLGEMVVLVIETTQLADELIDYLNAVFRQRLHPYEIPKRILSQANFPRSESGKIDIISLRAALQLN